MSGTLEVAVPQPAAEFSYRPVPPLAPIAFVLGLLSLACFVTEFALPIALIGGVLGSLSLRTFARFPGEFSGRWLAQAGVFLSVIALLGGSVLHVALYAGEVPEGFQRVNFTQDIARKGFVFANGREDFHEDVKALDGAKVFIKGYMYPVEQPDGLRSFLLCRDSGACCFGGDPKLTDMINVVMKDGTPGATYMPGLVSVAGVFHLRDLRRAGNLSPAYEIEATQFGAAKKIY